MPRRKVSRTAKQRAASRRNLVKARAARKRFPTGKSLLLYHETSSGSAKSIMKEGFKPYVSSPGMPAWFFNWRGYRSERGTYGKAAVSVVVPRNKAKGRVGKVSGRGFYTVAYSDLQGRKIRRVL